MTVMMHQQFEGDQSFTTQVWTQVASKTGQLRATSNFIILSLEYGGTVVNREVGIRVLIDGIERSFDYFTPTLANQYKKFCDFGILELSTEENHTISIEARALGSGQTVLIRRIRLMVMQL